MLKFQLFFLHVLACCYAQQLGGGDGLNSQHKGPDCKDESVVTTLPFCLNEGYEKHLRPKPGEQMIVDVKFTFNEIEEVNDKELSMTIDMHVRLSWEEPRLEITEVYNRTDSKDEARKNNQTVDEHEDMGKKVDQEIIQHLWTPDVSILSLKRFELGKLIKQLATLKIFRNKTVSYSFGTRATVGCSFFFASYPLDTQTCDFKLGSYGYTVKDVLYSGTYLQPKTRQRPLQVSVDIRDLPENERFRIERSRDDKIVGNYSVYGFRIQTERGITGFVFRTYFPSGIGVFVSWISFLIDQKAVAGRLALLVTLTLVEINIAKAISENNPPSEETTAIEIYALACLVSVVCALFEFALVIYKKSPLEQKRKERMPGYADKKKISELKKVRKKKLNKEYMTPMDHDDIKRIEKRIDEIEIRRKNEKLKKITRHTGKCWGFVKKHFDTNYIDICSICLFPTVFIAFNAVYWCYFLYHQNETDQ